ncbi:hypothetical protein ACWFRM_39385 [Streptomyces sp. NPDC055144]
MFFATAPFRMMSSSLPSGSVSRAMSSSGAVDHQQIGEGARHDFADAPRHPGDLGQLTEFSLRAQVQKPADILRAATVTGAGRGASVDSVLNGLKASCRQSDTMWRIAVPSSPVAAWITTASG